MGHLNHSLDQSLNKPPPIKSSCFPTSVLFSLTYDLSVHGLSTLPRWTLLRSIHATLPRRIFPAHSPSSEQLWSSSQKHLMCHFIHKTYSISCFPVFVKGRILLAYLACFVFLSSVNAASRFIAGSMMVTKYLFVEMITSF